MDWRLSIKINILKNTALLTGKDHLMSRCKEPSSARISFARQTLCLIIIIIIIIFNYKGICDKYLLIYVDKLFV